MYPEMYILMKEPLDGAEDVNIEFLTYGIDDNGNDQPPYGVGIDGNVWLLTESKKHCGIIYEVLKEKLTEIKPNPLD
jgi:hypothetical protein